MLASSGVNKYLHLAFNRSKGLSTETREEGNTLLSRYSFLNKVQVKLNGLSNQLHSGKPPSPKSRGGISTFWIFISWLPKIFDAVLNSSSKKNLLHLLQMYVSFFLHKNTKLKFSLIFCSHFVSLWWYIYDLWDENFFIILQATHLLLFKSLSRLPTLAML